MSDIKLLSWQGNLFFEGMKVKNRRRYLGGLFMAFLYTGIVNANQMTVCMVGNIPEFEQRFSWNLSGTGAGEVQHLTFSYSQNPIPEESYTIVHGGLVFVTSVNRQGKKFIFFNNNWQYNEKNGDFRGQEGKWTLYVDGWKDPMVFGCDRLGLGAPYPRRDINIVPVNNGSGNSNDSDPLAIHHE